VIYEFVSSVTKLTGKKYNAWMGNR